MKKLFIIFISIMLLFVVPACSNDSDEYENDMADREIEEEYYDDEWLTPEEAIDHVGEFTTVAGEIYSVSYREDVDGQPTFINLGSDYPDPERLTIVIWGDYREDCYDVIPAEGEYGEIAVTGEIYEYDGAAQIEVYTPDQIEIL